MTRQVKWVGLLVLAVAVGVATPHGGTACPFCTMQGQTLQGDVNLAQMVLFGKLTDGNEKAETTTIEIESIVKDNAVRGKQMKLTLARYVDTSFLDKKDRFLVFCDVYKGKIDPFRGMSLKAGSKMPEYLRGVLQQKGKSAPERLKFFFAYLDNEDIDISNDAYKEFGNADYSEFKVIGKDLPARKVISWLSNPDTPSFRMGLYASMLGHCGTDKDADVLKKLLDDPDRRAGSGIDGIMAGYAMLKPKEGWKYIVDTLKNTKEEFMVRYAALRAVRFLHDYRQDVVTKKQLVDGLLVMLDHDDIADLAIEDLRKWQCWDVADKVLAVARTEAYKQSIVKRAVLRYCLQCKGSAAATAYLAERRKADAKAVEEMEEMLKLDREPKAPIPVPKKK